MTGFLPNAGFRCGLRIAVVLAPSVWSDGSQGGPKERKGTKQRKFRCYHRETGEVEGRRRRTIGGAEPPAFGLCSATRVPNRRPRFLVWIDAISSNRLRRSFALPATGVPVITRGYCRGSLLIVPVLVCWDRGEDGHLLPWSFSRAARVRRWCRRRR
jgi:hypothetical protein